MQIGPRTVVTIDYTLKDDEGDILDTSQGAEPLSYLHGQGDVVPGLETALEGKVAGDKLHVILAPDQGYGARDERLVSPVPRERLPKEVEVGMQFEVEGPTGSGLVTVVEITDEEVTLDGNHPLAGMTLDFDVTVKDVRDATLEELKHGHVHGAGDHDHDH